MLEKAKSEILTLRKVTPSDFEAIREYREEFIANNDPLHGTCGLRRFDKIAEWYDWIRKAEYRETCPSYWVPDTQFIGVRNSDGRIVGTLDIRHELNAEWEKFNGHIGYSVRRSERHKGYATAQLGLAKEICRSMGMTRILVCCRKDNPASAKTILRSGGVLENEVVDERSGSVTQRYWITLSESIAL